MLSIAVAELIVTLVVFRSTGETIIYIKSPRIWHNLLFLFVKSKIFDTL